jgi:hypothetical protein
VREVPAAALDGLVGQLDPDHGEPVACEDLGDAGAHRAQSDDSDGVEGAGGALG